MNFNPSMFSTVVLVIVCIALVALIFTYFLCKCKTGKGRECAYEGTKLLYS